MSRFTEYIEFLVRLKGISTSIKLVYSLFTITSSYKGTDEASTLDLTYPWPPRLRRVNWVTWGGDILPLKTIHSRPRPHSRKPVAVLAWNMVRAPSQIPSHGGWGLRGVFHNVTTKSRRRTSTEFTIVESPPSHAVGIRGCEYRGLKNRPQVLLTPVYLLNFYHLYPIK